MYMVSCIFSVVTQQPRCCPSHFAGASRPPPMGLLQIRAGPSGRPFRGTDTSPDQGIEIGIFEKRADQGMEIGIFEKRYWPLLSLYLYGCFFNLGVHILGVLIMRSLRLWSLCWGPLVTGNSHIAKRQRGVPQRKTKDPYDCGSQSHGE